MRRWSSSLSMRLNVWRRSMTTAQPSPRAACSREMRWRSTSTCFCTGLRSPSSWENASFIAGRASTAGRMQVERGGALFAFAPSRETDGGGGCAPGGCARSARHRAPPARRSSSRRGVLIEGGETHHGGSQAEWIRSSRGSADGVAGLAFQIGFGLEVADFIADAGGFLVAFGGDRLFEARRGVPRAAGGGPAWPSGRAGTLPMCEVPWCMPRTIWPTSSPKVV